MTASYRWSPCWGNYSHRQSEDFVPAPLFHHIFFLSLFTMTVFYSSIEAQVYADFLHLQSNGPKEQTCSQAKEFKLYWEVRRFFFFFYAYYHSALLSLWIPGKLEIKAMPGCTKFQKKLPESNSRDRCRDSNTAAPQGLCIARAAAARERRICFH